MAVRLTGREREALEQTCDLLDDPVGLENCGFEGPSVLRGREMVNSCRPAIDLAL